MCELAAEKLIDRLLELPDYWWNVEVDEVIDELINLGETALKPLIYQFFGNPDIQPPWDNTEEVAIALQRMGDKAVKSLIAALDNRDPVFKDKIVWVLGKVRNPAAIDPLEKLLWKDYSSTAIISIGKIGGERAAEILLAALESGYFDKRLIITWLGNTKSQKVVAPLIAALNDPDSDVRRAAIFSLGESGSSQAVEPLASVLTDADQNIRYYAAYELASRFQDPRSADVLAEGLQNKSNRIHHMTLIAQLGNRKYLKHMVKHFKSGENLEIRLDAAQALIILDADYADEAILFVEESLSDHDSKIRHMSLSSFKGIKHRLTKKWLLSLKDDQNDFIRWATARELGEQGTEDILNILHSWSVQESHRLVRKAVNEAIEQIMNRTTYQS